MKRWHLIVIAIVLGALVYRSIDDYFSDRSERKEYKEKIKELEDNVDYLKHRSDSILTEYQSYKAVEASRLNDLDSAVQSYQKDISNLQYAYNKLRNEKATLQNRIDSLSTVIVLPDL